MPFFSFDFSPFCVYNDNTRGIRMKKGNNFFMQGEKYIDQKDNITILNSGFDTTLHHHDFLEIVYFKSGKGKHYINGKTYNISNGNICIINTGVQHYYEMDPNQKREIEVKNIIFYPAVLGDYSTDNFIDEVFEKLNLQPYDARHDYIHLSQDCNKDFFALINIIEHELALKELGYLDVVKTCMKTIMIKIFRQSVDTKQSQPLLKNIEIVEDAINLLQERYNENWTLADMERIFNYSGVYFNTIFKNYTGLTFRKYLQKLRCEKAKTMLEKSDDTIISICEKVGYVDVKQFFILFKRIVGLTPAEYRKKRRITTPPPTKQ